MAAVTAFEQIVHVGRETVRTSFEYIGENETPWLSYLMRKKKNLLTPTTFSLLHATDFAARYERNIFPLLRAGYVVLADRYMYIYSF